jgi:predicted ATPase
MGQSGSNDIPAPFLKRLVLKNYRSVAACSVEFQRFTALIGPNGAGKSNLLDALQFVSDSLGDDLASAVRGRGGPEGIFHRSTKGALCFGIRLEMRLPNGSEAQFAFEAGELRDGRFGVRREVVRVRPADEEEQAHHYEVVEGDLRSASADLQAVVEPDTLYLKSISGVPEFRPLRDALARMRVYNFDLDAMRDFQDRTLDADVLARDGSNITAVLAKLKSQAPDARTRIQEYMQVIVPQLDKVMTIGALDKRTLAFTMAAPPDRDPGPLTAKAMSDGTLRALGGLVAAFQGRGSKVHVPLVGIEEPELSLHPDATNALTEALLEASCQRQVLVTSHSPDVLDHDEMTIENIRAVAWDRGETLVAPVDRATRKTLREKLYTAGELLRMSQIEPDKEHLALHSARMEIFDGGGGGQP